MAQIVAASAARATAPMRQPNSAATAAILWGESFVLVFIIVVNNSFVSKFICQSNSLKSKVRADINEMGIVIRLSTVSLVAILVKTVLHADLNLFGNIAC